MLNNIAALLGTGVAASTSSYESIATATPSGVTNITFSSIPSTYKHLQIRWIGKNSSGSDNPASPMLYFNSDTGTNYSWHYLRGDGGTATAAGFATQSGIQLTGTMQGGLTANYFGVGILDIIDYADTTKYKTVKQFGGSDTNGLSTTYAILNSGSWRNTAAISSINISVASNNFASGTTIALYGVKG